MGDEPAQRKGQEGSRWINVRPTGEEVATWFEANVPIDDKLEHKTYVSGITMIPQVEKAKEVIGFGSDGEALIAERSNLVFIPYAKVETRVAYFWDLMAAHEDWLGVIEPVEHGNAAEARGLPPGFFRIKFSGKDGEYAYVGCTMKVTVYKREGLKWVKDEIRAGNQHIVHRRREGETIIDAPAGTKMVQVLNRYKEPDPNALMKAETGAVGRALGLAGMLVIPGTGVATADDVAESVAAEGVPQAATPEAAPDEPPADQPPAPEAIPALRVQAATAIGQMQRDHPEAHAAFMEWAKGRQFGRLDQMTDERMLRGLTTKAESMLKEAQEAKVEEISEAAEPEAPPAE